MSREPVMTEATATQSAAEKKLAEILVSALNLEDINPEDINPEAPLFGAGHTDGLGLDSIDALEIALAIAQTHGVQLKAEDEDNKRIFFSLRSLSDYVIRQQCHQKATSCQ